jgi:hypothetical protein
MNYESYKNQTWYVCQMNKETNRTKILFNLLKWFLNGDRFKIIKIQFL